MQYKLIRVLIFLFRIRTFIRSVIVVAIVYTTCTGSDRGLKGIMYYTVQVIC
jgi:hypothetical protein